MTKREFFKAVADGENNAEMREYAEKAIAQMDESAQKRREKPSKTQIANAPIREALLNILREMGNMTALDATLAYNEEHEEPITRNKASSLLTQMQGEGILSFVEIKSTAKSGGKVKCYSIVETIEE